MDVEPKRLTLVPNRAPLPPTRARRLGQRHHQHDARANNANGLKGEPADSSAGPQGRDEMPAESCPFPPRSPGAEISAVERMLAAKRIAVVGMSDDPMRPSNGIGGYLIANGYE